MFFLGRIHEKVVPSQGTVNIKGSGKLQLCSLNDYDVKQAYFLQITDFESMTLSWDAKVKGTVVQIPEVMTLAEYFAMISKIKESHRNDYIVINDTRLDVLDFYISRQERYKKINKENDKRKRRWQVQQEMQLTLHDTWFDKVQTIPHIEFPIKMTPKFSYNRYYHALYELLQKYIALHPLLTSDLYDNAFGMKETWRIYEYWVFSELLNRFINLGFKISSGGDAIRNGLISFFQTNKQVEGYSVLLTKEYSHEGAQQTIEVMLGYNCIIGDQTDGKKGDRHYTPDFFMRIKRDKVYHWYFMDAKYNVYSKSNEQIGHKSLFQEVYDVPVYKYIYRLTDKNFLETMVQQLSVEQPENWDSSFKNQVIGAYIIVANIANEDESSDSRIADEDRLYGGSTSLASQYTPPTQIKDKKNTKIIPVSNNDMGKPYFPSVDDKNGYPRHRYGAIQFRPGYEDEMTALLEMIFEYKEAETAGLLSMFGDNKTWPANLSLCWDSTFDHEDIEPPRIDPRLTMGGKYKFAVACKCGAQRYENHCLSKHGLIKHNLYSYHFRRGKKSAWRSIGDKWNYVCPVCGKDLNDDSSGSNATNQSYEVSIPIYDSINGDDELPF